MTRHIYALVFIVLLPVQLYAEPKSEYWDVWDHSDNTSTMVVDHSLWQEILTEYVYQDQDKINKVNYQSLLANNRPKLDAYISSLTALDPLSLSKSEQLPYWINLYNALTVQVITEHYPVSSILKISISPGFFNFGPWDKKLIEINDIELSLNDIEHRILRPIWKDPRIHYAVNCGSYGCPNLRRDIYTAETSEIMLNENSISYINHERGVKVEKGKVELSSLFDWYEDDFGENDSEVLDHIRKYASAELLSKLEGITKISDYEYNWDLNEVK